MMSNTPIKQRLQFLQQMNESRNYLTRLLSPRPLAKPPKLGPILAAHDQAMSDPDATVADVYAKVRGAIATDDRVEYRAAERYLHATYTSWQGGEFPDPPSWAQCVKVARVEIAEVLELERLEKEVLSRAQAVQQQLDLAAALPTLDAPRHEQSDTLPEVSATPVDPAWDAPRFKQADPLPAAEAYQEFCTRAGHLAERGWITEEFASELVTGWDNAGGNPHAIWHQMHALTTAQQLAPEASKYLTCVADDHLGVGNTLDWNECEAYALQHAPDTSTPLPTVDTAQRAAAPTL